MLKFERSNFNTSTREYTEIYPLIQDRNGFLKVESASHKSIYRTMRILKLRTIFFFGQTIAKGHQRNFEKKKKK